MFVTFCTTRQCFYFRLCILFCENCVLLFPRLKSVTILTKSSYWNTHCQCVKLHVRQIQVSYFPVLHFQRPPPPKCYLGACLYSCGEQESGVRSVTSETTRSHLGRIVSRCNHHKHHHSRRLGRRCRRLGRNDKLDAAAQTNALITRTFSNMELVGGPDRPAGIREIWDQEHSTQCKLWVQSLLCK